MSSCMKCGGFMDSSKAKFVDDMLVCEECAKVGSIIASDGTKREVISYSSSCSRCGEGMNTARAKFVDGSLICEFCANGVERPRINESLISFIPTKEIGGMIAFDDLNRLWKVTGGFLGTNKIYSYDEIVEYELLEDGGVVASGGVGRAIVGGLLFGGAGAIVGGVTAGKKSVVNNMKIKVTVNNFNNPTVFINVLNSQARTDSFIYKMASETAQNILSTFILIQKQKEQMAIQNAVPDMRTASLSIPDEILKFKNLLDSGIITQDEFEMQKKKLLGM